MNTLSSVQTEAFQDEDPTINPIRTIDGNVPIGLLNDPARILTDLDEGNNTEVEMS